MKKVLIVVGAVIIAGVSYYLISPAFIDIRVDEGLPQNIVGRVVSTGRGNFAMGVTEQIIFPEIDYDQVDALRGMDITITTSARTDDEGRALLRAFNFPLKS